MDKNYSDFPQSLKVAAPAPLDAKSLAFTLEELKDLGDDDVKAFTYFRGMIVQCQENGKMYQWSDIFRDDDIKLLSEDFTYPTKSILNGFDYSGLKFNFVEVFRNGKDGKDGKDGINGRDGLNGRDGRDGINGVNGNDGRDGQDGANGLDGVPGPPGRNGQTTYTWIKYADDELGSNMSDVPTINTEYVGFAYNKTTAVESTNPDDYTWSLFRGSDGAPGIAGPSIRVLEWVDNTPFYNNTQFKDYVYYRPLRKYYKLADNIQSYLAYGTPQNQSTVWIETNEVQTSLIAEGANIGGFIMRNNKLYSQAGLVADVNGDPLYSNLVLDGLSGDITLGNNRSKWNKESLTFFDSNRVGRLVINLDSNEVPGIRFYNADSTLKWEAGAEGYIIITEGTRPPEWQERYLHLVGSNRDSIPNLRVFATTNPNGSNSLPQEGINEPLYLAVVNVNTNAYELVSKGDIAENQDIYMAIYKSRGFIREGEVPSPLLIDDGWYIPNYVSGSGLPARLNLNSSGQAVSQTFYIPYVWYENGVMIESREYDIQTQII